ncbi:MAG: hypothetical protein HZA17_13265 [Nitrospirae bacterium]|nr:hypothetical protein [Nitrospirota bacterium]
MRNYADRSFSLGTRYAYKILSQGIAGILSTDSNILALSPSSVPSPPRKVFLKIKGASLVLSWTDENHNVLYNIYRSYDKGRYSLSPINEKPLSESIFTDLLDTKRPVYYTIRSLRGSDHRDESAPSDEIIADPGEFVPSPVSGVYYFTTRERIYLSWKEPDEPWVRGFRIYRKHGDGDYTLIGETQIPSFIDSENPHIKRDYLITSVGPSRESPATEMRGVVFLGDKGVSE